MEDYRKADFEVIRKMPFDLTPQWGQMTLQHMVEHLAIIFKICNGTSPVQISLPQEKVEKIKRISLLSDREFAQNFKAPILPDEPLPYQFSGINEAVDNLKAEIEKYNQHFKNNPNTTENHPVFGALNYEEWERYHNKHFTHHFKQFALI